METNVVESSNPPQKESQKGGGWEEKRVRRAEAVNQDSGARDPCGFDFDGIDFSS